MPGEPILYDEKAEQAVIGACLVSEQACEVAVEMLKATDIYKPELRRAFLAIKELYDEGSPVDELTVGRFVSIPSDVSGSADTYILARCVGALPSAANIEAYCDRVRSLSLSRALNELAERVKQGVANGKPEEVLSYIGQEADRVSARLAGFSGEPRSVSELAKGIVRGVNLPRRISGLACGVGGGSLDALIDGWEKGTYTIIAARTSAGKSTLGLATIRGISEFNKDEGIPLVITTEMSEESIARKDLAYLSGLGARDIKRSNLDKFQRERLAKAAKQETDFYVASMCGGSMDAVRSVSKRHKRRHGLPILLIDLAEKLGSPYKGKDQVQHCSYISGQIAQLKLELDCPIIACVQINRTVMQEADRRPGLHHLKHSGAWEEDCDKCILLHRPGYYGDSDKRTEVILAKDRESGETGSCYLLYDKASCKFVAADGGVK